MSDSKRPAVWDGGHTFVVAEVGINHGGDPGTAEQLVRAAALCGVDGVKFQSYTAERRVSRDDPLFDLLQACELDYEVQSELFDLARSLGVEPFSTPFDDEAVGFLSEVGVQVAKIASFDVRNEALLVAIAATDMDVILSRGMATTEQVGRALALLGKRNLAVLHCISAYPVSDPSHLNLKTIPFLENRFDTTVGFSDHTTGIDTAPLAVALGAKIVEKHFTLDRNADGPDHALSADPDTMTALVARIRWAEAALGEVADGPIDAEAPILGYRRIVPAGRV